MQLLLVMTLLNAPSVERYGVLVGANEAAPGRAKLRYSYNDVESVADVLRDVGGFRGENLIVLKDPSPERILTAIDQQLERASLHDESLVLFYYSGHADGRALYPGGRPLKLQDLKNSLETNDVQVRLGVIDACQGGGWTGTKGIREAEPFEVEVPMLLESEGSALIASSSGLEDAHESSELQGSFFTHHWVAALRGAGDENEDGEVTVSEAYDYAKRFTIRDTARHSAQLQTPSYKINLRGQKDLALARVDRSQTRVELVQRNGVLELVHLDSGATVLELPSGERTLIVSVPPGRYLVRRKSGQSIETSEIAVNEGEHQVFDEVALQKVTESAMEKSWPLRPIDRSTVPSGMWNVRLSAGSSILSQENQGFVSNSLGIPYVGFGYDRWSISLLQPILAYRGGVEGEFEWIPWGGLAGWNLSSLGDLYQFGSGSDFRLWTSPRSSVNFGFDLRTSVSSDPLIGRFERWFLTGSAGYSHTLADVVTFNFGIEATQLYTFMDESDQRSPTLRLGSVQSRALRELPLIQVHLGDVFSIDGYAAVE
ncbi:MAG: caspase family protein, partial [Myxococcota bacterium]